MFCFLLERIDWWHPDCELKIMIFTLSASSHFLVVTDREVNEIHKWVGKIPKAWVPSYRCLFFLNEGKHIGMCVKECVFLSFPWGKRTGVCYPCSPFFSSSVKDEGLWSTRRSVLVVAGGNPEKGLHLQIWNFGSVHHPAFSLLFLFSTPQVAWTTNLNRKMVNVTPTECNSGGNLGCWVEG